MIIEFPVIIIKYGEKYSRFKMVASLSRTDILKTANMKTKLLLVSIYLRLILF